MTPVPGKHASGQDSSGQAPLGKRLIRFSIALFLLWLVIYVLAPLPLRHFSPLRRFAESNAEKNQNPGALYYTDVPDTSEAEANTRSTVRFFSGRHREAPKTTDSPAQGQ